LAFCSRDFWLGPRGRAAASLPSIPLCQPELTAEGETALSVETPLLCRAFPNLVAGRIRRRPSAPLSQPVLDAAVSLAPSRDFADQLLLLITTFKREEAPDEQIDTTVIPAKCGKNTRKSDNLSFLPTARHVGLGCEGRNGAFRLCLWEIRLD